MHKMHFALPLVALITACGSNDPSDKPEPSEAPAVAAASAVPTEEVPANDSSSEPVVEPPRETLIGNWVPVSDTCTPSGGMSETAIWISEGAVSGAGWTCNTSGAGNIIGSEFSGAFYCGYGEGYEGDAQMSMTVGSDKILIWSGHEMASGGRYKKCSQNLSAPY